MAGELEARLACAGGVPRELHAGGDPMGGLEDECTWAKASWNALLGGD